MKIIWTEGKNLAFPDILSRNVKTRGLDKHQLKNKKIPKDILFYDKDGYEEKYFIVHDNKKGPSDEFFPVIKQNKNDVTRFKINNDKLIKISKVTTKEQICSLTDISSCFIQGSAINQVRMIQSKIPNNNASDEESDHNYYELSFELNTNPTQFGDYMSNYDIEDQSDLLYFETIDEQDEIIQECLLNDEIALCEQLTNKIENKKIATKLPNETLTNKDNLTQIFTSFNNLGKNIDLNTEFIAKEQDADAVIKIVRELVKTKNKDSKNILYRQSKALSSYLSKFETLFLIGNFLCIEQISDYPKVKEIKICIPCHFL